MIHLTIIFTICESSSCILYTLRKNNKLDSDVSNYLYIQLPPYFPYTQRFNRNSFRLLLHLTKIHAAKYVHCMSSIKDLQIYMVLIFRRQKLKPSTPIIFQEFCQDSRRILEEMLERFLLECLKNFFMNACYEILLECIKNSWLKDWRIFYKTK